MRLTWTMWLYLMVGLGYAAHERVTVSNQPAGVWILQITCWPAAVVEYVLDQQERAGGQS